MTNEQKLLDEVAILESAIGKLDYTVMRESASKINLIDCSLLSEHIQELKSEMVKRANEIVVHFGGLKPILTVVH